MCDRVATDGSCMDHRVFALVEAEDADEALWIAIGEKPHAKITRDGGDEREVYYYIDGRVFRVVSVWLVEEVVEDEE